MKSAEIAPTPKPRIALCVICRDNEKIIGRLIKSAAPGIDFFNVTDTGSKDGTKAAIRQACEKAGLAYKLTEFLWIDDFAAARNFNLSQCPVTDWLLWADSDDTLEGAENLYEIAQKTPANVGAVFFPYFYAQDEFGNTTTAFIRERLLRFEVGWKWRNRVHEVVQPDKPCDYSRSQDVIWQHHHTGSNRGDRNFALLRRMLEEEPNEHRVRMYLGHQHFACNEWIEAAENYLKFCELPIQEIDRYQALTYAARAFRMFGNHKDALTCDLKAVETFPMWADGYIGMCFDYLGLGQPGKASFWGEHAKNMQMPEQLIFINPLDYTFNLQTALADAYLKQGRIADAIRETKEAHQIRPVSELEGNIKMMEQARRREEAVRGFKAVANALLEEGEVLKLREIARVLPWWAGALPEGQQMVAGVDNVVAERSKVALPVSDAHNGSFVVGADFMAKPPANYYGAIKCNILDKVDWPLGEALTMMEQVAERVEVNIDHSEKRLRVLSQPELEVAASQVHRNIVDCYETEQKGLHLSFDHNVRRDIGDKMVVKLFTGPGFEAWNPQTIQAKGCGGSEISAAWLSRELIRQGHKVILYGPSQGIYDGVVYRKELNATPCDLFISSRIPQALTTPVRARKRLLWVHDVDCWQTFTPEIASNIDGILLLTRWHVNHWKRVYPWLHDAPVTDMAGWDYTFEDVMERQAFYPDAKPTKVPPIFILPDAILPERFHGTRKTPYSFVWCSAPDRGLEELLTMWPLIRRAMPTATLDIYYGWEYYDTTLHIREQAELKGRVLTLVNRLRDQGVTWRGRVNQQSLAAAYNKADLWLYPPPHPFRETCCISAIELQAAGVLCFYRMNGALGETIADRGIPLAMDMKPGDIVSCMVETLQDRAKCASLRRRGHRWARQQTWAKRAEQLFAIYQVIGGVT